MGTSLSTGLGVNWRMCAEDLYGFVSMYNNMASLSGRDMEITVV